MDQRYRAASPYSRSRDAAFFAPSMALDCHPWTRRRGSVRRGLAVRQTSRQVQQPRAAHGWTWGVLGLAALLIGIWACALAPRSTTPHVTRGFLSPLLTNATKTSMLALIPLSLPLYQIGPELLPGGTPDHILPLQPSQILPMMLLRSLHLDVSAVGRMARDILGDIEDQIGRAAGPTRLPSSALTEDAAYTLEVCDTTLDAAVTSFESLQEQLIPPSVVFSAVLFHIQDLHAAMLDLMVIEALYAAKKEPTVEELAERYEVRAGIFKRVLDLVGLMRRDIDKVRTEVEETRELVRQVRHVEWVSILPFLSELVWPKTRWTEDAEFYLRRFDRVRPHMKSLDTQLSSSHRKLAQAIKALDDALTMGNALHQRCWADANITTTVDAKASSKLDSDSLKCIAILDVDTAAAELYRLLDWIYWAVDWRDTELVTFERMEWKDRVTDLGEDETAPSWVRMEKWAMGNGKPKYMPKAVYCLFVECWR